jgi:hypothetical protein
MFGWKDWKHKLKINGNCSRRNEGCMWRILKQEERIEKCYRIDKNAEVSGEITERCYKE